MFACVVVCVGLSIPDVDGNGDGRIDITEFRQSQVQGMLSKDEAAVRMAFKAVDTDNSGQLDPAEFAQLLGVSEANVKEIMVECDKDGDGKISFEEFWAAMQCMHRVV